MENKEAYNLLNKFFGKWDTQGSILKTEGTPEIKISGTDTYEWLPGGFFLLHKADVLMGEDRSQTFEIIGFNSAEGNYSMQYYNNKGESGSMTATFANGRWTFVGGNLRFKGGFDPDEKVFSGAWEQLTDRNAWQHFMDIKLTKKH